MFSCPYSHLISDCTLSQNKFLGCDLNSIDGLCGVLPIMDQHASFNFLVKLYSLMIENTRQNPNFSTGRLLTFRLSFS